MEEKVAELAAEGYNDFKIASVLGTKVATVKELLGLDTVKALIDTFRARSPEVVTNRRYERIEDMALKAIEERIAMEEIPVVLKTLDVINKKREIEAIKSNGSNKQPLIGSIKIVNIALPQRLVPAEDTTIEVNPNGEIIGVGGRSFAPLSAPGVQEIFTKIEMQRKAIHNVDPKDF